MKTSEKIIQYIEKNNQASGKELVDFLNITSRAVRKQLKSLLERGVLRKVGRPPKVFDLLAGPSLSSETSRTVPVFMSDAVSLRIIEARYLSITPDGEMKTGWDGFVAWCNRTRQDPEKTAAEYIATLRKYDAFVVGGVIDSTKKLKSTFDQVFLDRLYFLDFYSIERFGKTKLGQLLLHAKNSQDRRLIKLVVDEIRPRIQTLVKDNAIDGVLYIPPTVKREIQFMKELEKYLQLPIRVLSVTKVKTPITIAQKTLTKLEDRIENAKKTIIVEDGGMYENILLIDDAVGSGSTMNETAAQIRNKGLCRGKIIGVAIAGSFKGFDVISEV